MYIRTGYETHQAFSCMTEEVLMLQGGYDVAAGSYPNAALEHLHSQPCWWALPRRLSSAALHHLLVSCSVFVQLPGSSALLQVAGHAFAAVARKRLQVRPFSTEVMHAV